MSSSSSVCQGLQSCLEPLLVEPRILRLKLATPKPTNSSPCFGQWPHRPSVPDSDPEEETNKNEGHATSFFDIIKEDKKNGELGGWSFIDALADAPHGRYREVIEDKDVYIHPLTKRSASTLSQKSLEMCTESLGSESGSDEMSSLSAENSTAQSSERAREFRAAKKKVKRSFGAFPPPLTSISGSTGCVKVRPHREGGRLVISAVTVTECHNFHADRSDGRLRLRLVKEGSANFEEEEEEAGNWEENGEEEEATSGHEEEETEEGETGEEEQKEVAVEEEEGGLVCGGDSGEENMDGNCVNVGGEMGTGKFPRPRWCRSGNLDPFWGLPTAPLQKPISQF